MLENAHNNNGYLLHQVALGDENSFRQLFSMYWDNIYSVAFRFTKSCVVAEEIVQDVFIKIWNNREKLSSINNFDNYLFIIARNHIYNHLRQRPFSAMSVAGDTDPHQSPEQLLCLKETRQIIARAVDRLPSQQKIIFEMSRGEGMDYSTIAKKLHLSKLTVKTHMHKAIESIRAYLTKNNGAFILALSILLNA